ncbi:odorant receptor 4 isoform X2 [Tribolium castaneum]|uniref:odorant receptor 4 isoform X2 n=1 Tax=Tribolium castaneum TaxID=7070 RepID=UPI00077DAFDD|nr:PREDICTED: odorant receptor 4 isoform X2 [Tribolium castaneum]|eukprot:XP_015838561.1 PREDICTED: odorant receptor 4 isoform X2 [Tribolium castaneum]
MANFNWTKIIETNFVVLKVIGLWPEKTFFACKLYNIYTHFMVTCLLVIHLLLQTIQLALIIDEFQLFLTALPLLLQQYHLLIKLFYFMVKFPILRYILHSLNNHQVFQPQNQDQKIQMEDRLSFMKKIYFSFYSMAGVAISFLVAFPILDILNGGERQILFVCWFPYDYMTSPFYEFTYFYQSASIIYAGVIVLQIDTLVTLLMTYLGFQCDLLCENLTQVGYNNSKENNTELEFVKCIKHHQELKNHCVDFSSGLIFVQVATSSIAIGLTLFQMTLNVSTFNVIFLVLYGLSVTFQMFQYCWFGSEVIHKSDKIAYSAFEMNFVDAPLSVKENLVIFMACTQKPIKMPVLKVTHLSLQTFTKVLRTAWSYFALLVQVSK